MLSRIRRLLGVDHAAVAPVPSLPTLDRAEVEPLLVYEHDLPHVDWQAVGERMEVPTADEREQALYLRAIAGVWLDVLRDSLKQDHRRWRSSVVEGVGPVERETAARVAAAADRAAAEIRRSLRPLRGDEPIPPVAVIALSTKEAYYSLISRYYPEEGEFASSGGVYIAQADLFFPFIAFPMEIGWAMEATLAHELTHHALESLGLPRWLEEGYTQMMEERVTGYVDFELNREKLERHRVCWGRIGIDRFFSGESFSSPGEDQQELSYHLAQLIVRSMLADRAADFFAFTRECGSAESIEEAAERTLGMSLDELAGRAIGLGEPGAPATS